MTVLFVIKEYMKKNKLILPIFVLAVMLLMFSGCLDNVDRQVPKGTDKFESVEGKNNIPIDEKAIENIDSPQQKVSDDVVVNDQINKTLVVDGNKCIGCGKCAHIAATNFLIQKGQAVVVSSEDIESSSVQQAINNCPVKAISYQS